jgi:hypothetical protein
MLFNPRYHNAWRRRDRGVEDVLRAGPRRKRRRHNPAQLELNFCAGPWRPLVVVAKAAEVTDRPLNEEELAAEFERLFPEYGLHHDSH